MLLYLDYVLFKAFLSKIHNSPCRKDYIFNILLIYIILYAHIYGQRIVSQINWGI